MILLIFLVVVFSSYWHLCLYISREKNLTLCQSCFLYGIPVSLCVGYVVNQALAIDYQSSFFMNIFMTVLASYLPVGLGVSLFKSEYWSRSQPTKDDWQKLNEEQKDKKW
jgi:hypothetical protein